MSRPGILYPGHEIAQPMWKKDWLVFQHNMVFYFTIVDCWEISGGPGSCVLSLIWSLGGKRKGERLIIHKRRSHKKAILSNWIRHRGGAAIPFHSQECFLSFLLSLSAVSSWKDHLWMVEWVHQSQLLFFPSLPPLLWFYKTAPLLKTETADAAQILS